MSNIITVKRSRRTKINRSTRNEGIIRISAEAADILEELLTKAEGTLTVKDLASELIKYAANDTIINVVEEETEGEEAWQK